MSVNYNEISKTYDNVRSENKNAVELFIEELKITDITRVLDFGCGTGNYADVGMMFAEIGRVLKNGGNLCIVTESHKQIDNRFYVKYFPSTAIVDKGRYPDIDEIVYNRILYILRMSSSVRKQKLQLLLILWKKK